MNFISKILLASLFLLATYAGPKEDFVEAVKTQCSKSEDEAKALATPGRAGNVIAFKLCAKSPIELNATCKITCQKDSASIGG